MESVFSRDCPPEGRYSILFDLDDTVFDFHLSEYHAFRRTARHFGIEADDAMTERYSRINDSQWKLLEKGLLGREELKVRRFRLFLAGEGIGGISPEEMQARYEKELSVSWFFIDGAPEMLAALAGKYDLYLATNGIGSVVSNRIALAGIGHYFRDVFVSQELGYNKPDKRYFDACFARAPEIDPSRCVIVGDSLTSDMQGGRNAGITTLWFNRRNRVPDGDVRPDYEVTSLDMVPLVLEMIADACKDRGL